ncbi:hypothetical protein RHMOL_Rhmol11G0008100 [Rhododendron molle]|uniref:Uncharacterized protein n=1 Tax=Rhododendron molle TaxID=49168 RepID=A0ACC0LMB7_RHOML|nr:hypothetical protein RHMOL_Rhmol11G0008100 [Rhododendron molle]
MADDNADFDENKPLWKYVTKLGRTAEGGGNLELQCNLCNHPFKGSYTRVKAYFLKIPSKGVCYCKKMTHNDHENYQRENDEAELRAKNAQPKLVPLPPPTTTSKRRRAIEVVGGSAKKANKSPLEIAFNMNERDQLHSEIARMFYSGGLPFNLARNPYYATSYTFAANHNIPGYLPPGYNMLRTTLLKRERANIDRLLQPIKGTWRDKGMSFASDGWSDSQRRPLINFMAVNEGEPMFLKAVDCLGETKDKYFIANLMKEVINEVGPLNVIQVITDNAPNCKAGGQLIEAQFPHILWTPCVVHTLNLALKNICAAKMLRGMKLSTKNVVGLVTLQRKLWT